jgi:hypothetical protein
MRLILPVLAAGLAFQAVAQDSQPLETPSTPFDFDNYRRTPLQARQPSNSWASKDNQELQKGLLSGQRGREENISTRAAALFQDPGEIPIRQEPEPLPTPNELTDEITTEQYGQTTKGQRDLLARGRVAEKLDLSSMSETDYELYIARRREEQGETPPETGEALLRPMPTLINTKTGGPPHGYAVSQAGVGARAKPRNNQNPFEDLIRVLRLDRPVTKGTDPLPAPSARLTVAANGPTAAPSAEASSAETSTVEKSASAKP